MTNTRKDRYVEGSRVNRVCLQIELQKSNEIGLHDPCRNQEQNREKNSVFLENKSHSSFSCLYGK